jgi:hypothetical protein
MSLVQRVAELAARIGDVVATKIDANHPGVARAWVCFGYVGNQIVLRSSHNVAGVTRTAAGRYRITFAAPMPDANYCWTALARSSVDSGQQRIAVVRANSDTKTAQHVDVSCATAATSFADSSEINLVVYR